MLHQGYLIMFGGILEITKESEDIFIFHIATSTWKMIDLDLGPQNLNSYFDAIKAMDPKDIPQTEKFKMRESRSLPDIGKALKESANKATTRTTEGGEQTMNATGDPLLSARKEMR